MGRRGYRALSKALRKIEAEAQRSGLTDGSTIFENERMKEKESKPVEFLKMKRRM